MAAIFAEMHDPELVEDPEADAMDPLKRVRMFQHMGALQVGSPKIPHFQPPLGDLEPGQTLGDAEHTPFLLAVVCRKSTPRDPTTGQPYIAAEVVTGFVRDYYRDCAGAGYEADPFYQRIIQACSLQGQDGKIPLVPFEVLGRETAPNQRPKGLKPKPAAAISTAPSRLAPLEPPAQLPRSTKKIRVAVVGAGLAGLACAQQLRQSGRCEAPPLVPPLPPTGTRCHASSSHGLAHR